MLLLSVTHWSRWGSEEFVVARTILNGSNRIRTSAKPLPDSRAYSYHVKTNHGEGENKLRETAIALRSLNLMQTMEESESSLAGNVE